MSSKLSDKIIRILLYSTAFLPLILTPFTMYAWQFGKSVVFQMLVEAAAALWLWKAYKERRVSCAHMNWIDYAIAIFLCILLITSFTGSNPAHSVWGDQARSNGVFLWLHLGMYYVLLSQVLRDKKDWLRFFQTLICVSAAVSMTALFQSYLPAEWIGTGGNRLSGIIGNPDFLGVYIVLPIFIALYLCFDEWKSPWKFGYAGIAALDVIVLFLSGYRGAFAGLVAGLCAGGVLAYAVCRGMRYRRHVGIIVALFIVLTGAVLIAELRGARIPYASRFLDIQSYYASATAQTRLMAWQIGWRGFQARPMLGFGMNNFEVPFNLYYNPQFLRFSFAETVWDKPHNWLLELLDASGVFGLLSYLFLYGCVMYYAFRAARHAQSFSARVGIVALMSGLIAHFVALLFLFETFNSVLIFFTLCAYVSALARSASHRDRTVFFQYDAASAVKILSVAGICIIAFCLWRYNYIPLVVSYHVKMANQYVSSGDFARWGEEADRALSEPSYYKDDSAILLMSTLMDADKQNVFSTRSGQAIKEPILRIAGVLDSAAKRYGQNYEYPIWAGQAYLLLGQYVDPQYFDSGERAFLTARERAPLKQETYFFLGRLYLLERNFDKSIDILKQAVAITPGLGQTHWFLGLAYVGAGNQQEGLKEIERAFHIDASFMNEQNLLYVIDAYVSLKDYARVIHYYQVLVDLEPDNPLWYGKLAAAYVAAGDKPSALHAVERARQINPDLGPQLDIFIKENKLK